MTDTDSLTDERPHRTAAEERARDERGTDTARGEDASDPTVGFDDAPSPPRDDGLPLLGHTVAWFRDGLALGDRLQRRGDVVEYDAVGRQFVAVFDPELVEEVLVTRGDEFQKGEFETEFASLLAPNGLVTVEDDEWRRQRRLLQPAFTPGRIEQFAETMVDDAAALADDWADGSVVPLREALSSYSLSVLARTLLAIDLDAERGAVVREAAEAIAEVTTGVSSLAPEWLPTPATRRYDRAMAGLDDLVAALIAERRETTGEHDDLLATLLDATYPDGSTMDAETVRDQLVTFLFAGHETSSTALTYACWLLAGHPEVRERLDAELTTVLGDRDPTVADLSALQYTEQVVEETLRLYPPVFTLYRQPVADTTLGGYATSADTTIQLATYHIQRDGRWWDAPEEFRPERFDDDDPDRPDYAAFPFGGGPRHCIGMRFATMELKLALTTLARRVRFERVEPIDPSPRVVLDPGETPMRVWRRESA
ncbi:Cytochrome P450 [Halogranum amylolyticum]|uniref:Cytochrome P450 n=1 Tax=Halogranum amylolyticum TaxID=660520 RepID=A0A1H8RWB4_9EURY|nr:cytochrome P450 [Halogranum amylolyticum]SEO70223.1 Cytochrome P450 [Halogranum amylolyticum]